MINEDAVIKDINLIKDATNKGAKVIAGGMRKKGLFIEPTILCNIDSNMDIFSSAIKGVVNIIKNTVITYLFKTVSYTHLTLPTNREV